RVGQQKLKPGVAGVDFWKMLAFQPDWDASPWLAAFKAANGQWAKELQFDENRANVILRQWFSDVRMFSNADLGLDWLLRRIGRSEPMYHDRAAERVTRTFVPADFAPKTSPGTAAPGPATVDLAKASFLFTGKMASMTREEAEQRVKAANGTVAG